MKGQKVDLRLKKGGSADPPDPPGYGPVIRYVEYSHTHYSFGVKFSSERRNKERKKEDERIKIFVHDFLEHDKG